MFAISVKETGEWFDTRDITISYVIKGPVFRSEDNDGSFVFNTTLPPTDNNRKLTGFLDRIEHFGNEVKEINVQVWFKGLLIWDAVMLAKFAREEGIEVSMGMGRGEWNYEVKNKKLIDVMPDEEYTVGREITLADPNGVTHQVNEITGFDEVVTKKYPEVNYAVFPVKQKNMCSSLGKAFDNNLYKVNAVANMWDMERGGFYKYLIGNGFGTQVNYQTDDIGAIHQTVLLPYNIFLPFVYNNWVFKHLFSNLGYYLKNNPFEKDNDFKQIVLYNTQSINKLNNNNKRFVGGVTINKYFYELQPSLTINLKNHVPDVGINEYLRAFEDMFFFRVFISSKTKSAKIVFLKDLVASTEFDDISGRTIGIKERKIDYEGISALVQSFDDNDNMSGELKDKTEVEAMDNYEDFPYYWMLPFDEWGNYQNKISYIHSEKRWYLCSPFEDDYLHVTKWIHFAWDYFIKMLIRDKGKELKVGASGMLASYFTDNKTDHFPYRQEWWMPLTDMPLKFFNNVDSADNICGLRFLFYRGMQEGILQKRSIVAYYRFNSNMDRQHFEQAIIAWGHSNTTATMISTYILEHSAQECTDYFTQNPFSYEADDPNQTSLIFGIIDMYCTAYDNDIITSTETKLLPMGSNDVYDFKGRKISDANLSTKWDGEYGIYEKFAKEFVHYKNNIAKAVTLLIQPTVEDLFTDFSIKKRINGIDYLFDEIRGEIKNGELSVAEVDAFSC